MASATYSTMAAHTRLPSLPTLPSASPFSSSFTGTHRLRLGLISSTTRAKFDKFQGQDYIEPEDDNPQLPQFQVAEEEDDRCAHLA